MNFWSTFNPSTLLKTKQKTLAAFCFETRRFIFGLVRLCFSLD